MLKIEDKKIALVCIAKNEDNYIHEWIDYHKLIGFDKIFVYQNDWNYPIKDEFLQTLPINGQKQQVAAYNHFINSYQKYYQWAAFIDVDEFIVLKKHKTIQEFIRQYQDYPVIAINWVFFGSNNLKFNGEYSVLKRFTKCEKTTNQHIKVIMKLDIGGKMANPHFANISARDTNGKIIQGPFNPNGPNDVIQINHYWYKTDFEFQNKLNRGRADYGIYTKMPHLHIHNDIEDLTILNNINCTKSPVN